MQFTNGQNYPFRVSCQLLTCHLPVNPSQTIFPTKLKQMVAFQVHIIAYLHLRTMLEDQYTSFSVRTTADGGTAQSLSEMQEQRSIEETANSPFPSYIHSLWSTELSRLGSVFTSFIKLCFSCSPLLYIRLIDRH